MKQQDSPVELEALGEELRHRLEKLQLVVNA